MRMDRLFGRDSRNGVNLFIGHWMIRRMKIKDIDNVRDRNSGIIKIIVRNRSIRRNTRNSIRRKSSDFKILSLKIK